MTLQLSGILVHAAAGQATQTLSVGCSRSKQLPTGRVDRQLKNSTYRLTNPTSINPKPLLLLFHGWGGSLESLSDFHEHAFDHDYVVAAPLGYSSAQPWRPTSWNGAGSTASPGPFGPTCTPLSRGDSCYEDCNGRCTDDCWWTTCRDSVAQALEVLTDVLENACIDEAQIWASGCSNGGIFMHELATDERIASKLRGVIPMIGAPHPGFNFPPASRLSYLGIWGDVDGCVPAANMHALEDAGSGIVLDTACGGWRYVWHENVTSLWAASLGCTGTSTPHRYKNGTVDGLTCSGWSNCGSDGVSVMGCVFPGGHNCTPFQPSLVWCQMQDNCWVEERERGWPLPLLVRLAMSFALVLGLGFWACRRWYRKCHNEALDTRDGYEDGTSLGVASS